MFGSQNICLLSKSCFGELSSDDQLGTQGTEGLTGSSGNSEEAYRVTDVHSSRVQEPLGETLGRLERTSQEWWALTWDPRRIIVGQLCTRAGTRPACH